MKTAGSILCCLMLLTACSEHFESADDQLELLDLETLPEVVHPDNNPTSDTKVKLGKYLFYDPILSGEKDVACVTCHHPKHGYSDGIDLPIGVGGKGLSTQRIDLSGGRIPVVGRNAPTVINAAFNGLLSSHQQYNPLLAPMFWDGRRKSLEYQSLGPPTSFNEMRGDGYTEALTYDSITARLKNIREYDSLFTVAFGAPGSITEENIGKAIAAFERTIVSSNSPYDQYVKGNHAALDAQQKLGLKLFFGKANCATCHSGPMFSDYNYYSLGIENNNKLSEMDKGLNNAFLFRTPTLRNVTLTAPYMHNGKHATLEEVMDYYNHGETENSAIPNIDPKLRALSLDKNEIDAIIAFMKGLTDDSFDRTELDRVPSGLKPGGN